MDGIDLLRLMIEDERDQADVYRPGPFWRDMADGTARAVARFGLSNFRGESSIGWGFADNVYVDVRHQVADEFDSGQDQQVAATPAFQRLTSAMERQVELTRAYESWFRQSAVDKIVRNERTADLLSRYRLDDTLRFGCVDTIPFGGQTYARHYLKLLDQHDRLASLQPFGGFRSMLELGGGIGINTHILIQNYPGLRKFFYVDIPPALYVGTMYLRSLFGAAVKDYAQTRRLSEIRFENNEELEIICVPSWQIEKLSSPVDLFYNAHSFVEMPEASARHYAQVARALLTGPKAVAMVTYDAPEGSPILAPAKLPDLFQGLRFKQSVEESLDMRVRNFFFMSATERD